MKRTSNTSTSEACYDAAQADDRRLEPKPVALRQVDVRHVDLRRVASRHEALRPAFLLLIMLGCSLLLPELSQAQLLEEEPLGRHTWQTPGCHRVGHTRRISIPECVEFDITTNACRGYCESWSLLTAWQGRALNPQQRIISVGQCCNIMATEDVQVKVMCIGGPRELVFKSAKTCSCFHCKKY